MHCNVSYNTLALWIQVEVVQVQHSSQGCIGSIEAQVVKVEEAGSRPPCLQSRSSPTGA